MQLRKLKNYLSVGMAVIISAASVPFITTAADQQEIGNINGYSWEIWNQSCAGTVNMEPHDKSFECSWDDVENCVFDMGYNYTAKKKNYKKLNYNITVDYDIEFSPKGNAFFGVYGWMEMPLAEYYIIEGWGSWRPPGSSDNKKGVVTLNGNLYDVYKTMRYNQPCILGTMSFPTYWSVRQTNSCKDNTTNKVRGTVNVSDHFDAWDRLGLDVSGTLYNVVFDVEGFRSSGSANVKKLSIYPPPPTPSAIQPDSDGYYIKDKFESAKSTNWLQKGYSAYSVSNYGTKRGYSLCVCNRVNTEINALYPLDTYTFKPGNTYSIGAALMQQNVESSDYRLLFQYKDANGVTQYDVVASNSGSSNEWVDLSNRSYTLPDYAYDPVLYFEVPNNSEDFYLDDFYIGIDKTQPLAHDLADTWKNIIIQGDINNDGTVDLFDLPAMRKVLIDIFTGGSNTPVNADLNGDSEVTVADLVLLQRYLTGKEKEFAKPVITTAATTTTTTTTTTTAATGITKTTTSPEVTASETSKITTIATTALPDTTASEPTTATVVITTAETPSATTKVSAN